MGSLMPQSCYAHVQSAFTVVNEKSTNDCWLWANTACLFLFFFNLPTLANHSPISYQPLTIQMPTIRHLTDKAVTNHSPITLWFSKNFFGYCLSLYHWLVTERHANLILFVEDLAGNWSVDCLPSTPSVRLQLRARSMTDHWRAGNQNILAQG